MMIRAFVPARTYSLVSKPLGSRSPTHFFSSERSQSGANSGETQKGEKHSIPRRDFGFGGLAPSVTFAPRGPRAGHLSPSGECPSSSCRHHRGESMLGRAFDTTAAPVLIEPVFNPVLYGAAIHFIGIPLPVIGLKQHVGRDEHCHGSGIVAVASADGYR